MKRVLPALLVIVIAILGWLAWPRIPVGDSVHDLGQASSDGAIPAKASGRKRGKSPGVLPTKGPLRPPQTDPRVAPSHEADELGDFIIPMLDFEDAPVQSALLTLMAEYTRICEETGEVPGVFNVSLLTEPQGVINLHLQDVSFLSALDLIAMQAGLQLSRDGFKLLFDAEESDPAAPLQTRLWRVSPDLVTRLRRLVDPAGSTVDPFSSEADPEAPTIADLLPRLGVVRAQEASASLQPDTSTLQVRGDATDLARVELLVEQLGTQGTTMIKSEVRFLDTVEALQLPGERLDPAETEALLARAAAIPGTTLEAKPSVVTRPGQTATIEVGEELIRPVPGTVNDFQTDWIGFRIELQTARYGFDLQGGGSVFDQSMGGSQIASGNVQLQRSEQEFLAAQASGQTVVIETSTPQGSPRYVLVTHHLVDATGRPIDPNRGQSSPP